MTENDRKYAIECIDYQIENGYLDLGCHDQDELEVVREAMSALKVLEQVRWERDVDISQLEELGLSLGQKVDHVKEVVNKQTPQNIAVESYFYGENYYCPSCNKHIGGSHNDLKDVNFCEKCGQRITINGN